MKKKFDVVIGNPPYQKPNLNRTKEKDGSRKPLWEPFVYLANHLSKDNGIICLIHPSAWRKPGHDLFKFLTNKSIQYLSINDDKSGNKIFGASTRFDWYVIQNTNYQPFTTIQTDDDKSGNKIFGASTRFDWYVIQNTNYQPFTTIQTENNKIYLNINIINPKLPFIPNFALDIIFNIIGPNFTHLPRLIANLNTKNTVLSKHINEEQSDKYIWPIFHSYTKSNGIKFIYSSIKDINQNNKKVLFNEGRFPIAYYDNGQYGTSNGIIYITVENDDDGKRIEKIINSKLFQFIISATKWSNFRTDWRMFKYFPYCHDIPVDFTDDMLYDYFGLSSSQIQEIEDYNGDK